MFVPVMTKARTRGGVKFPAEETRFAISFNDDDSITIYRDRMQKTTFRVGDTAEYDSYNLKYIGEITKITKKAITIVSYKGTMGEQVHRLSLNEFCWRNDDFDLEKVRAENADTMQCI